ncbi:MAG: hypothetical protein HY743_12020 [Deltaproteobacteria bacterium]|nr:hypothetical protein [Deltaproteobacteria bacterium]
MARLDPGIPLIILSHAPLVEIYRPWQQWTKDGPEVMRLLSRFSQVFCFHGHVHQEAVSFQLSAVSYDRKGITRMEAPPPLVGGGWGEGDFFTPTLTLPQQEGGKKRGTGCRGISRYGLPSTAWPLPSPLQGTLTAPRPGLGPRGSGWALMSLGNNSLQYQPQVWRA